MATVQITVEAVNDLAPSDKRNSTCPSAQRLNEVARPLALGILRLRARRRAENANDRNRLRGIGLDFAAEGSVGYTDAHDQGTAA